eukprot:CAMPEP_0176296334 /NCGR_PEP_ID=MMETSP0121_2-20121125/58141_1 /TAXON_ID=160619 /ORGANISM="Kryptoperidinium foliaceum, Strain CCMP 1326" /LENGTH=103 /DNA_ID=CAMNT_0017637465 /DNA_START=12 /DNA_END=318 /DNA_ORIENTATION=-
MISLPNRSRNAPRSTPTPSHTHRKAGVSAEEREKMHGNDCPPFLAATWRWQAMPCHATKPRGKTRGVLACSAVMAHQKDSASNGNAAAVRAQINPDGGRGQTA